MFDVHVLASQGEYPLAGICVGLGDVSLIDRVFEMFLELSIPVGGDEQVRVFLKLQHLCDRSSLCRS